MRRGAVALTAVVLVGGVAAVLYSRSLNSKEGAFKIVNVTRGGVTEKALAVGAIRPKREIAVKSKISGIVKKSYREVGDRVRAGELLFDLIPDPTPLELTEARREAEIAQNVYEQAKKSWDRVSSLREQGILATQEWEKADKDVQDAQIRLNLAREKLALVEKGRVRSEKVDVESVIRAPIDGTVLELLVNEGDPVVPLTSFQAGTPLANLADMTTLVFKGTVDEIDVGKLKEGMPARIKVGALPDAKVGGTVYKISPKSKTAEGATLFDVEIELHPGEGVMLRAGYSANADVVVREKADVLLLPERLVTFAEGKATVEIPGPEGKEPVKKEIKAGLSDGLSVEVVEGLKQGDGVVERPPKKIE
ncbi:MAG TPA: efflux RND transporter periplasmic adaptor subunit [Vicinamibacteria bacterium]|nr:efflux RND transporter periplasmic adaptor subunit [Vicinamibacteria bacterium]